MGTLQLPDEFRTSYENFKSYPCNLIHKGTYSSSLKASKTRLDAAAPKLFTKDEREVDVPFRDLDTASGQALEKCNIHSTEKLKNWLGDNSTIDPLTLQRVGALATKRDPKCRFIFIWAEHSRKPLKITQDMLTQILSYHQVMPVYLDFISVFGSQSEPRDLRFSGFREQTSIDSPARGPAVPDLGRNGRQYQLCYNLKSVKEVTNDRLPPLSLKQKEWSIRQAAFHHQFDMDEGTTLWIVTKGHLDIQQRVKELTGKEGRPEDKAFGTVEECFQTSLAVHLLYCHWATEEWHWYIRWLEEIIDYETRMAVLGPRGPGIARQEYTAEHLQIVQAFEDKTNEAIMVLEANVDVMSSLREFYNILRARRGFSLVPGRTDIMAFSSQLYNMVYDLKMQIARAKLLVRITTDRKNLVLQHLQSQATEKMEKMTMSMHEIGSQSQKEAIAMRIITVVTLIYLPATFVSTFFSTDVIKYQDQNGGRPRNGSFSTTALIRWLQVTIPLTALTLSAGYIGFKVADKRRKDNQVALYRKDFS